MKYRIINGLLLLFLDGKLQIKKEDLYISSGIIESIGSDGIELAEDYEVIDAENMLIMSGLINMHTHVYMNFMKNSADDVPFHTWLNERIFPVEARMRKEDFYWTTMFGIIEMINTGTTCFLDMHICKDECAKAVKDAGVRAFLGKCITGSDIYADAHNLFFEALEEKSKYESDLLKFVLSPHSVYACSPMLLEQIAEESEKRGMLKHIHISESSKEVTDCLSEYGKTPVELLDSIGFLDNKTIGAHCVMVSESDIDILSRKAVNVVTNPSSNAKLGNGIAPVSEMMKQGINVCLGTDSAASNNTLNMFREMGIFSLIHKALNKSATELSAGIVLECATQNSAKALNLRNKIGRIVAGACADLLFIDLNAPSLYPCNNILSSLCYSANGSEVNSVMISGKFIMRNGIFTTIDTEQVYYEIQRIKNKYLY